MWGLVCGSGSMLTLYLEPERRVPCVGTAAGCDGGGGAEWVRRKAEREARGVGRREVEVAMK